MKNRKLSALIDLRLIKRALTEDTARNDVTTLATAPHDTRCKAKLIARQNMRLAGIELFGAVFKTLNEKVRISKYFKDGATIEKGDTIAILHGPMRAILSGERVALNFLQHMSGIATMTARYCDALEGSGAKILDTRKTTPGLRDLEKYAVLCGGGKNHRRNLSAMALIKENHVACAGGIARAVLKVRRKVGPDGFIEVEARNLAEVAEAVEAGVERIMLDNMTLLQTRKAVELIGGETETEASGNMTPKKAAAYAITGVDYISVGAITHSAPSVNVSLLIE